MAGSLTPSLRDWVELRTDAKTSQTVAISSEADPPASRVLS